MFPDNGPLPGTGRTVRMLFIFFCLLLSCGVVLATPAPGEKSAMLAEVKHLLTFVAASDCQFNRNGVWHDGKEARAHLETKFDYLAKRNEITNAEDFIAKAATKSSLSGREYQFRCQDAKTLTSARWLSDELLRYRRAMEH